MDASVARILDANANRAREGLRVLEDFARFHLNDAELSGRIKTARHDLADAVGPEWRDLCIRARDTQGDIGRAIATRTEYVRQTPADVARAAGKRVAEALRALEEYAKTADAGRARSFERLRYRCYEMEQGVAIRIDAAKRFACVRLYVLLTEASCVKPWHRTAEEAIAGGADAIQLREKSLPDGELLARARRLSDLCRSRGVTFLVNDRPDIARLSGADGVHVGQDDLGVPDARRMVGPDGIVGISTHSIEQARAAMRASPDYIAVGPMFASPTKPQAIIPGPELIARVRAETSLPIVAIGGIDAGNVSSVIRSGATAVCICAAIIGRNDVERAAGELKHAIDSA
ncbi:MAG: thiamine phosphate synthase [Phycisphaerales bacterium]|nr:thiamine phosphate synthase [Phycisphaerales bacterium]